MTGKEKREMIDTTGTTDTTETFFTPVELVGGKYRPVFVPKNELPLIGRRGVPTGRPEVAPGNTFMRDKDRADST